MQQYQGKKVVIIGGTSGMGLATAKMLLDGGARVLVTGRSHAGLESAQKELGKDAIVVSSDARSLTEIDALASRVKTEFDTIDLSVLGPQAIRYSNAVMRPEPTGSSPARQADTPGAANDRGAAPLA